MRRTHGVGGARRAGLRGVGFLLLWALGASATSAEEDLARRREDEWRGAQEWLLLDGHAGSIDEGVLRGLASRMPSFDAEALETLADTPGVGQLPDERRVPWQHALRSLAYLRDLGPSLDRGPAVCLLLGQAEENAWARGLVELLREPFGERLGAVAERLARDRRGPVRRMAGTLALYLNAFCRGSGSDWGEGRTDGWDPTPVVRGIATRLLDDPNPAVACSFAAYDACAFEDKSVVDRMVALLRDPRQMPRVHAGLLEGDETSVGEACRSTLYAQFVLYRAEPGIPGPTEPDRRTVTSLPEGDAPEAIARWWTAVRERWRFTPDAPRWRKALDAVLTIPRHGTRRVDTPFGPLHLTVAMYGEGQRANRPVLSIQVDVRGDEFVINLGNPRHHPGFVGWSATSGWHTGSVVYAPSTDEGIRMRVRLYTTRTPK